MATNACVEGDAIRWTLRLQRVARRSLFRVCRAGVRYLSFEQLGALGAFSGDLQFRLGRTARQRMLQDVRALLPPSSEPAAASTALRTSFRVNNAAMLEVLKILDERQDAAMLASKLVIDGLDRLTAALAQGRGAILVGTHSGNNAMLLIRLAQSGIPLSAVHRDALMMDAGFFAEGVKRYGVEPILANQGATAYRTILSALRRNRAVFLCIDQGVKKAKDGMVVRFLGKDMPMPAGAAHFARRSNAPVLPVATLAATPLRHAEILPPLVLSDPPDLAADLATMLHVNEQAILNNPHLWSWHQRRWRRFPLAHAAGAVDLPNGKTVMQ